MAGQSVARFRNIVLTQGGADAFVQQEEVTGIDPASGQGWLLKRLEVQFPLSSGLQGLSADSGVQFGLTRDPKTAVSDLSDSDTIMTDGFFNALTTSGELFIPDLFVYHFPEGVLVVEPSLYAHLDSSSTGLTLTANMRLYYETVKLSEVEILRMLTQG